MTGDHTLHRQITTPLNSSKTKRRSFVMTCHHCMRFSCIRLYYCDLNTNVFSGRFCRTDFITQRPYLKSTDMALRDTETSVQTSKNTTSSIQQFPIQHKSAAHQSAFLATTKNTIQFSVFPFTAPKLSDTRPRIRPFSQTNSLAGGETAPMSRMSILQLEHHTLASVTPHCKPNANMRDTLFAHAIALVC